MSITAVREYLRQFNLDSRIEEFEQSSATVELAAQAAGVVPARIAKTLSFKVGQGAVLIVTCGDTKIDNQKYKAFFGTKAKMLTPEEVERFTGHAVGGVCPFAVPDGDVRIYLDESIKRFDSVLPAAGSSNSCLRLNPEELMRASGAEGWIDVCKLQLES